MRKYVVTSAIYGVLGLCTGVFYREFTKMKEFTGRTSLGMVHPHLLGLGMLFFLLVGLLAVKLSLEKYKTYKAFFITYNIGAGLTGVMLLIRGILEVNAVVLDSNINSVISFFSGLSHATLAAGLVLLFIALFKATKKEKEIETK